MSRFFPYTPRPTQESILREVRELTASGGTILLDASTGSGKTVSVLAPLLEHAIPASHTILYLVRTHAQATQVLREVKAIREYSGETISAVTLEGRSGRCPLMDGWEVTTGANPEEYSKLCADRKRSTEKNVGAEPSHPARLIDGGTINLDDIDGCPYYATLLSHGTVEARSFMVRETPDGSGFTAWARENGFCPYELSKALCRDSNVVVAPYITFFHAPIRSALLGWIGSPMKKMDIVIDEAHNLPDYLRELSSYQLTEETVTRAIREVELNGDPELVRGIRAGRLLERVCDAITGLAGDLSEGDEGLLPEGALEERLLTDPLSTTRRLEEAFTALAVWGDALREARRKDKALPRSYAFAVSTFVLAWGSLQPPTHLKLVVKEPKRSLTVYSLDATHAMLPAREAHLTIHMSGTLAPLEEYRDSLGIPTDSRMLIAPPSFPTENRRLFYSVRATTRYEDLNMDGGMGALREEIVKALRVIPVKTAIFFPSFVLMKAVLDDLLRKDLRELNRKAVVEVQGLSTEGLHDLIRGFKKSTDGSVLIGVCGGRISEGLDFPNEELGAVILAGIPYPRPTARREALSNYLEATVGKGWEHCYAAPARRAIQQALGRMIRSEKDRGLGVILDRRAVRFEPFLGKLESTDDLERVVKSFFPMTVSPEPGRA